MIKVDVKGLKKDLERFRENNLEKMQGMVRTFSYKIAETAILNTPFGDATLYASMYEKRETDPNWQSYGLYPFDGFARGSWRVSTYGGAEIQEIYGRNSGEHALKRTLGPLKEYNLGDTVIISNLGPYIKNLERNSSQQTMQQGIMAPTIDSVMQIAAMSLRSFYDNSIGRV